MQPFSLTPWNADRAAKAGAGLMLCGHTHGGQIWPFGYLVKRVYPLFAGRYDVDGMSHCFTGGGHLGPAHAPVGAGRDHQGDAQGEEEGGTPSKAEGEATGNRRVRRPEATGKLPLPIHLPKQERRSWTKIIFIEWPMDKKNSIRREPTEATRAEESRESKAIRGWRRWPQRKALKVAAPSPSY